MDIQFKDNELNNLINNYHIEINKFLISTLDINYYNRDNVVDNNNLFDLTCPICYNILKNPKSCSEENNSHSFCQECIDRYFGVINNKCPIFKKIFEYKSNDKIEKSLYELLFKCLFYKEGCTKILKYNDYFKHILEISNTSKN